MNKIQLDDFSGSSEKTFKVDMLFNKDTGDATHGFEMVGANSPEYQAAERSFKVSQLKKTSRRGHTIDAKTDTGANELADVILTHDQTLVRACIKGIYGWKSNGEPVAMSDAVLDAIFSDRPTWYDKLLSEIKVERDFTNP